MFRTLVSRFSNILLALKLSLLKLSQLKAMGSYPASAGKRLLVITAVVAGGLTANASMAGSSSSNGNSENRLERLRAAAANPHHSIDPADYTISLDDSCGYVISSADREIKKVVYFDLGGNKHVAKRDHYGNRFGTEVSLSDTSLAGVVEAGGTLFIKLRRNKDHGYRRHGSAGVIEFTDIPMCEPAASCPAVITDDPLFLEYSTYPDRFTTTVSVTGSFKTCRVLKSDNSGIFLQDDLDPGRDDQNVAQFGRSSVIESPMFISNEQFDACAVVWGCIFPSE